MAVIRNLVIKVGADIGNLTKGLKTAQQQLDKVSKKMGKVGASLTASFTVPFLSFATLAVKASSDIEDSMYDIERSFNTTGKEIDSMTNLAKKMSSSTIYGINEVAEAMNYLKKSGYSVAQMESSLATITNLATASNVELEQATNSVVKVLGQFNLDAKDTDKVTNVMAATLSKTSLTLDELTNALSVVGNTSTRVGITIEETSAAIAMLSNAGFGAEKSGRVLKSIIEQLETPTTEMTKVLNELGLNIEDVNPKTNSLSKILEKFAKVGVTSTQATRLFGKEVESAFMSLISDGSESLETMTESLTGTNAAEEEANKQMNTLSNTLKEVKNQLNEISVQLGEILLPILKELLQDYISPLIEKFSSLSNTTKKWIVVIGGVLASLGPVVLTITKIIKSISSLSGVLASLASPVGIIIAVIAALIAVIVGLWNTNEEFRTHVMEIWNSIKDIVTTVVADLKAFWDEHGQAILEGVKVVFSTIWKVISGIFNSIMAGVQILFSYIKPIWEQLKALFASLWDTIVELYNGLKPILEVIGAIVLTCFGVISGAIEGAISALGPLIQAVLNVMEIIIEVVNVIISLFKGDFTGAFEHIKNIGEGFKNFFVNLWQGILNFGKGFVDGFVRLFNSMGIDIVSILNNVFSKIGEFFTNLWHGITSIASNIWDAITGVFKDIGNWFGNLFKEAFNWGKNLVNMIGDGIRSAINWVGDAVGSVIDTIAGWLGFGSPTEEGPGRTSDEWAPNLMKMYTEGLEDGVPDIQDAVGQVTSALANLNMESTTQLISTGDTSISADILNGLLTAMSVGNKEKETNETIELSIDGTVFARLIYPSLTKEFKRNGVSLKEGGFI